MRGKLTLLAGVCAGALAFPAFAQDVEAVEEEAVNETEIIVTAQRTNQRLQDVPIAVSAFSAEALDKQQIKTTSDLQLTLPNITFTKTNFTGSSFTIRGIGDLCVGTTCDSATAIHMNDAPLFSTRLFEGEFYDLAQIEVLRGPQGTLFGKNATSGVVNFRTARPRLGEFSANAEAEYGNYDHIKMKGMINVPIGDSVAVRLAGVYLKRDGYTTNLTDGQNYDNRDSYGLRGSIRFEPTDTTKIDVMAQYFHEKDNRMRIQKQMCQRDATGILGCLNSERRFELTNANATFFFGGVASKQFFAIQGLPTGLPGPLPVNLSLIDLYNPVDGFAGAANPADVRTVTSSFTPTYFTDEWIIQGDLEQELGSGLKLKIGANYQKVRLESEQGTLGIMSRPNMAVLAAGAGGAFGAGPQAYFAPVASALIPNGPTGIFCTSAAEPTGTGVYGGHKNCNNNPMVNDRSNSYNSSWTTEAIISSDFDGKFNFLLGGIYGKYHLTENSYYGASTFVDYFSGVAGALKAFTNRTPAGVPAPLPPSYIASPFFRNNTDDLKITSYGLFGEAYFKFNDQIKLTLGVRYNNDSKDVIARSTMLGWLTPHGTVDSTTSPYIGAYDADPGIAGNQLFQIRSGDFSAWTGRAVLDYALTSDNLIYASYSRGYKSGGINPPLSPVFAVPESFKAEFVDAFEIGSKNSFADGKVTLNLTGFYYKYKDLQLSRIVSRTAVNDNVSANIWGLEAEAILRPTPELSINANASYLNTEISQDKFLSNPRDFGGGRADAVIIKDISNFSNCAVSSASGSIAGVNAFVNTVNTVINGGIDANGDGDYSDTGEVSPGAGLAGTTSFGSGSGIASTGAYSICAVLQAAAAGAFAGAGLNPAAFGGIVFGTPASNSPGIDVNIKGNKLPGAPDYKFSAGVQYAAPIGDLTLTPRVDFIYTGKSSGNIFGGPVNEIPSFTQVNAQIQLDGQDNKWFMRAWIQNVFDKDSITGLYLTDQSQGLATNIFTLEPRRYGIAAGIKF